MFQYTTRYRRVGGSSRVYRMSVIANDADEARAKVAIRDPLYGSTVESPKRRSVIPFFDAPSCWFCKRTSVILDGTYTAIDFGGELGIQHVCDDCRSRADDDGPSNTAGGHEHWDVG